MIWLQRLRKDVLVDCLEIALDREKTSCQIVSGFCESCFCLKNLSSACLRDSHLSFQEIRFKIVRLFHFPAQERQEQLKCKEHEQRTPMKLKVKCKNCYYHKEFSLKRPRYDASATLRSLSEQPFDFTMHYNEHRESTYVMVKSLKKLHAALLWLGLTHKRSKRTMKCTIALAASKIQYE